MPKVIAYDNGKFIVQHEDGVTSTPVADTPDMRKWLQNAGVTGMDESAPTLSGGLVKAQQDADFWPNVGATASDIGGGLVDAGKRALRASVPGLGILDTANTAMSPEAVAAREKLGGAVTGGVRDASEWARGAAHSQFPHLVSAKEKATAKAAPTAPAGPAGPMADMLAKTAAGQTGAGQSGGASSIKIKSSGGPGAKPTPGFDLKAMADAAEGEKAAIRAQGEVAMARGEAEADLASQEARRLEYDAARRAEVARDAAMETDARMKQYEGALKEASNLNEKVDPGAFWESRNTGQKILAGIGLFLGSVVSAKHGTANNAMTILNDAIASDIDAQKANIASGKKRAADKVEGARSLHAMAKEGASDALEQQTRQEAFGLARAKAMLEQLRARHEGAENKAKFDQLGAMVDTELAGKNNTLAQFMMKDSNEKAQLRMQRQELELKTQAASAGPKGRDVPAGEATAIGELQASENALDALSKAFDKKTGKLSGAMQHLPGTDASKYVDQVKATAQTIGRVLEGGKLTDADLPRYVDMLPSAGDSTERKTQKIQILQALLKNSRAGKLGGLTSAGFETRGFSRPATSLSREK